MHKIANLRAMAALLVICLAGGCDSSPPVNVQGPGAAAANSGEGGIAFVEGYTQGYQHAQSVGKPMLVFFTASWCDYCHQMLREAFADQRVIGLSQRFVCILVDSDAEPEVCREFQIRGFPTVQFLTPRGIPLNRLTGMTAAEPLALQMQAALQAVAVRSDLMRQTSRQ
jgi:thiol:disulfide interchange protein